MPRRCLTDKQMIELDEILRLRHDNAWLYQNKLMDEQRAIDKNLEPTKYARKQKEINEQVDISNNSRILHEFVHETIGEDKTFCSVKELRIYGETYDPDEEDE